MYVNVALLVRQTSLRVFCACRERFVKGLRT
jgi:hypothetical protein